MLQERTVTHIPKVLDNTVLHGLADLEIGAELLSLSADHDVLDLCTSVAGDGIAFLGSEDGPSYDRREDKLWEVGASIADFDKLKYGEQNAEEDRA